MVKLFEAIFIWLCSQTPTCCLVSLHSPLLIGKKINFRMFHNLVDIFTILLPLVIFFLMRDNKVFTIDLDVWINDFIIKKYSHLQNSPQAYMHALLALCYRFRILREAKKEKRRISFNSLYFKVNYLFSIS